MLSYQFLSNEKQIYVLLSQRLLIKAKVSLRFNCVLLKNVIYLNNNFMVYLLQLHINPFSEWHLAGASVSYGHFF